MQRLTDRNLFWLAIFALYAATAGAIRLAHIETITGDTSESFLWSLDLAWGYGVQPPLYAWVQWVVNLIFGPTLLSTVVMRGLCHFAIYAAAFTLARHFVPARLAGLAALGVFLVPEISQTFLRTRTHNMLATAIAPLIVLSFANLLERGRGRDHVLFGAASALGILAKATVATLPVVLILAALIGTDRGRLNWRGAALGLATAALILTGPALWMLDNLALGTASLDKFEANGERLSGLERLAEGLAATCGGLAVFGLIAVVATRRGAGLPRHFTMLAKASLIWLAITVLGVLISGASEIKEHWVVPAFAGVLPVAMVAVLQRQGWARFLPSAMGGFVAVWMLAVLPDYHRDRPLPPLAPFAPLAEALAMLDADRMFAPQEVAANVIQLRPDLPIRKRVNGMPVRCEGSIALIAEAPRPVDGPSFTDRIARCAATLRETLRIPAPPGREALDVEIIDLTPTP